MGPTTELIIELCSGLIFKPETQEVKGLILETMVEFTIELGPVIDYFLTNDGP